VRERGEPTSRADLAISGDDLIAIGCEPGPALGATLDKLLEIVLVDPRLNEKERLLELARK
jgi:tRNA nucleotidyltransferase (CCA-adding enzyme)